MQTENFVDQLVTLADSATPENAQAVRLRVDTRKWLAGKMLPKKYGDKAAEYHSTTTVNNSLVVMDVEQLKRLQQRNQEALRG